MLSLNLTDGRGRCAQSVCAPRQVDFDGAVSSAAAVDMQINCTSIIKTDRSSGRVAERMEHEHS